MQNIISQLAHKEKGLVFISAPTNSGKTTLIQRIKQNFPQTIVVSGEWFLDAIMQPLKTPGETTLLDSLASHKQICIEDLDWYGGREHTEYEFAATLSALADHRLVVVTGIDLKTRMNIMFSKLTQYDYYENPTLSNRTLTEEQSVDLAKLLILMKVPKEMCLDILTAIETVEELRLFLDILAEENFNMPPEDVYQAHLDAIIEIQTGNCQ